MKTKNIQAKNGTVLTEYKFENGDECVAQFEKMWESEERLGINKTTNKPFKVRDYLVSVIPKGQTNKISVKLTKTQADYLKTQGDLKGKTIKAESYTNKYGEQVKIKVV